MTEKKVGNDSKIIGYWMSEKKSQKLKWTEFAGVCRKHGFSLVKMNLDKPLENQGPFTVILHKLTEIIVQTMQGNTKAKSMIEEVEAYIENHPEVAVIDPLDNVRKLLDRYITYKIIHNSNLEDVDVFIPTFVELTSDDVRTNRLKLRNAGVGYPFVCKPSVGHGSKECHKMMIIFNESGLADCKPPCVAQTFVNHNAVLFKIYVVGDKYRVVERPSLKNFYASNQASIHFDSHDVSKPDSTSSLTILDPEDMEQSMTSVSTDPTKLAAIVEIVTERLGMSLLGIDVVVENSTGRHAIIDVNSYPSYDGYPNFFDSLMDCILERTADHKRTKQQSIQKNLSEKRESVGGKVDQEDSGFDTSDSSDEKKRKQRLRCTIGGGSQTSANQVMSKKHLERQH
uniref:Inositol-tetrakisphosphate 1-kinase n=1 Tax=Homalodisca liturata TaxID=320908 RepID=A0A1B6HI43_9HEMI